MPKFRFIGRVMFFHNPLAKQFNSDLPEITGLVTHIVAISFALAMVAILYPPGLEGRSQ
jgi:hypothetical protein